MLPGGGGSASRIIDQLDPLFTEIVDGLGELAGNEAFYDTLRLDATSRPDGYTERGGSFTVPGKYGFDIHASYTTGPPPPARPAPGDPYQELQSAATRAWHAAHDEYAGGGASGSWTGSLRTWSQNVWEPDPQAMSVPVDNLATMAGWLNTQTTDPTWASPEGDGAPHWLANLKKGWPETSRSSHSFYDFWNDVNEKCALYAIAGASLTGASARVMVTLADFQTCLLKVTKLAHEHVRTALQQWQRWKRPGGMWPSGEKGDDESLTAILDAVSYGTGVLGLAVPVTAEAAGTISVVTGGASYIIKGVTGTGMKATRAQTADAILQGLYDDLSTIDTNMRHVLDHIRSDPPHASSGGPDTSGSPTASVGFHSYVGEVRDSRSDWEPPEVNL